MTNEPTTGEIVRALREDCSLLDDNTDKFAAADRLESLEEEKKISRYLIEMQSNVITELTARAESAEAREKAMVDYLRGYCQFCERDDCMDGEPPCCDCENVTHDGRECKWELRGLLPQDGEKE